MIDISTGNDVINLRTQCVGLDDAYAICKFDKQGNYINLGKVSIVERLTIDSLRNSKISLKNLPRLEVIEVESLLFDKTQPCDHFDVLERSIDIILENVKNTCVSIINLFNKNHHNFVFLHEHI